MKTAVVLFTRALRVRDDPALAAACEQADLVIPLFAVDATLRPRRRTGHASCWSP